MRIKRNQIVSFSLVFSLTIVSYFLFEHFYWAKGYNFHEQFYTDGYSFRSLQTGDDDFSKYKIGEIVDPLSLKTRDGRSLVETYNEPLILLAIVDPACGFCRVSQDIMTGLRTDRNLSDVRYLPAIFTKVSESTDLIEYAESIGFSDFVTWRGSTATPEYMAHMPTPAHLLIDRNGKILQVWFSSSRDEMVRRRMKSQISTDVALIQDVYKVLVPRQ